MQWPWNKAESDLDREVQHHLETLGDAYERQGLSSSEAMRQAKAEFGGVDKTKEECRDIRWWSWMTQVGQDLRFGWRMMRKTPAITVAAVASLALGIGATTAILSLGDALLWRTLPVPEPQQLEEVLWEAQKNSDALMNSTSGGVYLDGPLRVADYFSHSGFEAMKAAAAGKAQIAGFVWPSDVSVSFDEVVVVAKLRGVTGGFFSMLGLQPFAGRLLTEADDDPASPAAAVVSHRFWVRRLGANPEAVGRALRVNNAPYTIVGILPADYQGVAPGDDTDLYSAASKSPQFLSPDGWLRTRWADPKTWWMQVMARREIGATAEELRTTLDRAFASSWVAQPSSAEETPRIRLLEASRGLGAVRRQFGIQFGFC